ncbi:asparagine synthase-related protein, partial [Streptomyces sp. 2MCAF27]
MKKPRVVRSFSDLATGVLDQNLPVVTLFSGGLDSTYLLYRLRRSGHRDIHAISVDVGGDE